MSSRAAFARDLTSARTLYAANGTNIPADTNKLAGMQCIQPGPFLLPFVPTQSSGKQIK
jgi:hypothetical protein